MTTEQRRVHQHWLGGDEHWKPLDTTPTSIANQGRVLHWWEDSCTMKQYQSRRVHHTVPRKKSAASWFGGATGQRCQMIKSGDAIDVLVAEWIQLWSSLLLLAGNVRLTGSKLSRQRVGVVRYVKVGLAAARHVDIWCSGISELSSWLAWTQPTWERIEDDRKAQGEIRGATYVS